MSASEEGDPNSALLVLGQAPGRDEIKQNSPLVGPSGQVFKDCLNLAGLSRRDCYILNIWPGLVYEDAGGKIFSRNGGPELWNKSGFTEHGLDLAASTLSKIRESGSRCILTLGQQALALCTDKIKAIMKWRGSPLEGVDRVNGKRLIPTVHPAATIHGVYLWRYLIISDMKKAKRQSESLESIAPKRNLLIEPTIADALNYIRQCEFDGLVATDIECVNHQVSCFSLSKNPGEAITIPLTCERGDYWSEEDEELIWLAYARLMSNPQVMKVNQNLVGFDSVFLMSRMKVRTRGPIGDSMIAQSILYPEFNKGLDFIASVHTCEPYWKDEGKMWKNEGGDFPTFWKYCGKDSAVALEAWLLLAEEMTQREMWPTYNRTVRMMDPLMSMTLDGLAVDAQGLVETKLRIEEDIATRERELLDIADFPFNPASSRQCAKYFYEHKGITPYKNAAGGITTDDKAMSRIFRKTQLREAKLVQEIRNLRKLKSTYLEVTLDADHRLRCSWNPRGTWTGRLSSSQTIMGTGMNLTNVDPRFKTFIVEDPT